MARIVMIYGDSGTGKSASLRNFKKGEVCVFEVAGKDLPFKNDWGKFVIKINNDATAYDLIESQMLKATQQENYIKRFVIDDSQYLMAFEEMNHVKEKGFEKFTNIALNFYNLLRFCQIKLPDDVIVYFLHHAENADDGTSSIMTIGKMLSSRIKIEGLFNIVLKTEIKDNKHYFLTNNSDGLTVAKAPMGMFEESLIDNDLKAVDSIIREYYK